MHAANIPIANISKAMEHTIEVHLKSYARFKPNATAYVVAAVNAHQATSPRRGPAAHPVVFFSWQQNAEVGIDSL